jgi:hypothetical protein
MDRYSIALGKRPPPRKPVEEPLTGWFLKSTGELEVINHPQSSEVSSFSSFIGYTFEPYVAIVNSRATVRVVRT